MRAQRRHMDFNNEGESIVQAGGINPKVHHLKKDVFILVMTFLYYLITQFKINPEYSSGYQGIWWFFTLEHLILLTT
jgi:hypothetical protein